MNPSQRTKDLLIYLMIVMVLILIVYLVAQVFYTTQTTQDKIPPYNTSFQVALNDENRSSQKNYKIIGYFPNWAMYRQPSFKPEDINASLLTHINYAFIRVDAQGNLILFDPWADTDYRSDWSTEKPYWGHFRQLNDLKKKHPHLKTFASLGGWTLSDPFSEMAAKEASRQNFIKRCIEFCDKYDFDGIDIDWEYPGFEEHHGRPEDKANFTLLLQQLYAAVKAHNPPLLLTFAAPAGPHHYKNIEVDQIHHYLDWINLMGYDFHGPWQGADTVTNHNAPLYATAEGDPLFNVDSAVTYYLSQGFPAEKIVLGMPFYGRSFAGANSTPDGLYSAYSGPGIATTVEPGMCFFYDIKQNLLPKFQRYWDDHSKVPYLHNKETAQFISYDDEESIREKCRYLKRQGLGGAMVWELSLDLRPKWLLMNTINQELQ